MSAADDFRPRPDSSIEIHTHLTALGLVLRAYGYAVQAVAGGLIVRNTNTGGCCPGQPYTGDTITCRARLDDGGRYWFFTSWRQPIAPADRYAETLAFIERYLGTPR
ncbi:hypothetical protein [Actinomadura sp. 9N407]|uniref:hypothetical protein n=1 Tax=Actinomadura sp. 9N407 TaxID=3375154 RepID=UPI00378D9891